MIAQQDTKAAQIMAVITEGPTTAAEIGATLQMPTHKVTAHLHNLFKQTRITRQPFHQAGDSSRHPVIWLWSLPRYTHPETSQ